MNKSDENIITRRGFLRSSASAAVGGALVSGIGAPGIVSGSIGTKTLNVGLIGCGGRGTGAAFNALQADPNVVLTAMGDTFEDNLRSSIAQLRKKVPDKVKVPPEKCFVGLDAFEKVLKSDVDVVLLATPPVFRPQHLAAAVAAGKHSFVEITNHYVYRA